jgi:hypothetical protein
VDATPPADRPILVLGVCQRTGTNFLAQLLLRHADTGSPKPVWEHFLLEEAQRLVDYADGTRRHWAPGWADLDPIRDDLLQHLGGGLLRFLADRCDEPRVVAKCPSVVNLSLAPRLFRDADLVLLVRDGRSVTESMVNGFGWSHERAMRRWAAGARELLEFTRSKTAADERVRFTVVRYEDLVAPGGTTLDETLAFAGLDPARYDREAADTLPVYGSSFAREGEVTWKAMERPPDFDPATRFAHWDPQLRARFDWVGGELLEAFGYERDAVPGPGGLRQRGADAAWPARNLVRRIRDRVRAR